MSGYTQGCRVGAYTREVYTHQDTRGAYTRRCIPTRIPRDTYQEVYTHQDTRVHTHHGTGLPYAQSTHPPWYPGYTMRRGSTTMGREATLCAEGSTYHGGRLHSAQRVNLPWEGGYTLRRGLYQPWEGGYTLRLRVWYTSLYASLLASGCGIPPYVSP